MFEECCRELTGKEKYAPIRECFSADISKIHRGYFSQDKKGRLKVTKGDTQTDGDNYNTIMREKEWLFSLDCSLHSGNGLKYLPISPRHFLQKNPDRQILRK